ncbi:MAG TPA: Rrf2 family transcriptional regulator [Phycisphaerae bacterium]|nr:Rrf2 family transcriptional regulator [Phycisphaerae bacterium]HNU44496.1 Rrf2 family transcriptional regulator [Phycisphaerae bacterium]
MISRTAEYALRAVVWLANHGNAPAGTREIAKTTQVPVGYLSKVLQALSRANLVCSRPGRGGGFVLSHPARRISVLDVVNAVDPIERLHACPLGDPAHRGKLCPLHQRLDRAAALVEQAFAASPIAELALSPTEGTPFCADGGGNSSRPTPGVDEAAPRKRRPGAVGRTSSTQAREPRKQQ